MNENLNSVIDLYKFNNIKFDSIEKKDSIVIIYFIYFDIKLYINVDIVSKIYYFDYLMCDKMNINSQLFDINLNKKLIDKILMINLKLSILKYKEFDINEILEIIDYHINYKNNNNLYDNKKLENHDDYNFFSKEKNKTKFLLDELLFKTEYNKIINNIDKKTYNLKNIPEKLLKNKNMKFIINNINEVNKDFSHNHYIIPEDNNPFKLLIRFQFKKGKIGTYLKELNKTLGFNYVELRLILDPLLYPYVPVKLEYIKPLVDPILIFNFNNIEFLKLKNWNPFISLNWIVINFGNFLENIISNYIFDDLEEYEYLSSTEISDLCNNLVLFSDTIKMKAYKKIDFNLKFNNLSLKVSSNKNYLPGGTGYGFGKSDWNYHDLDKKLSSDEDKIINYLDNFLNKINSKNISIFLSSCLPNYLLEKLNNSILDLLKHIKVYMNIFLILEKIIKLDVPIEFINILFCKIDKLYIDSVKYIQMDVTDDKDEIICCSKIKSIYNLYFLIQTNKKKVDELHNLLDEKSKFKKMVFNHIYDIKEEVISFKDYKIPISHKMHKNKNIKMNLKSLKRIKKEIFMLRDKNSIPIEWDSSILLRIPSEKINIMTFLISGPKDTPYHNGLFEFHVSFPENYPLKPPHVLFCTNGNGTIRMNPNLYQGEGKTCLSLLGTWHTSQESEGWIPTKSNLLQVMTSIQAMILGVSHPYFNEPTYEKDFNTDETTPAMKKSKKYNDEKRYFTIKWAINNNIKNPPISFEDFVKDYFITKEKELLEITKIWLDESGIFKNKIQEERQIMIELINNLKTDTYNKFKKIKIINVSKEKYIENNSEESIMSDITEESIVITDSCDSVESTESAKSADTDEIIEINDDLVEKVKDIDLNKKHK
jgi:ubiquitin-protein ligase